MSRPEHKNIFQRILADVKARFTDEDKLRQSSRRSLIENTANYLSDIGAPVKRDKNGIPILGFPLETIINIENQTRSSSDHGLFTPEARAAIFLSTQIPPKTDKYLAFPGIIVEAMREVRDAKPSVFEPDSAEILTLDDLSQLLSDGKVDLSHEHLYDRYHARKNRPQARVSL